MKRAGFTGFFTFFLFMLSGPAAALELAVQGGLGFTTQSPALFGLAASINARGDSKTGSWFSDTQLIYHRLRNTSIIAEESESVTIALDSFELNWFLLLPLKNQGDLNFFGGPGIGYGVAEVEENNNSDDDSTDEDASRFFTAKDIHYGTLLLKFGINWGNKTCEGRISSFGGLIGGTVLCGILF